MAGLHKISFTAIISILLCSGLQAGPLSMVSDLVISQKMDEANRLYEEGQYDSALEKYTELSLKNPESTELLYNIGNVHYRKGNFEEAQKAFEASLVTEDSSKKASAWYNIGNAVFRQGATSGDMSKLEEAIEAYKKCLKENPDSVDAKYNIEYIRRKLKENAQKQNQQQNQQNQDKQDKQQQDQQQQNQDQQKQDQQQQSQDQQNQNKQDQQKQDENKEKNDQDKQNQQQQDRKNEESDSKDGKQPQNQEPEKRTKVDPEQAKRWLDRLKEQEKENMKKEMIRQRGQRRGSSHDW